MQSTAIATISIIIASFIFYPFITYTQEDAPVQVEAPEKITATWEVVHTNKQIGCTLHRTKVPGGWLIIAPQPRITAIEVSFLKDPYHTWLK